MTSNGAYTLYVKAFGKF